MNGLDRKTKAAIPPPPRSNGKLVDDPGKQCGRHQSSEGVEQPMESQGVANASDAAAVGQPEKGSTKKHPQRLKAIGQRLTVVGDAVAQSDPARNRHYVVSILLQRIIKNSWRRPGYYCERRAKNERD